MSELLDDNSIFFQCKVLDTQDPMMLGRIRGVRLIDNYLDIIGAITDPPWNPEKDPWTSRDPLVFNPLLPYFLYQVPKVDELVQVMYLNKDFKYQNQYYVQNTFSSPTSTFKEFNFGGNKFTGTGMQIKNPKPLKNQDGTYTDRAIHKGVFPEPGDNAILGRGSADVVVKQDDVLIRAGKFKGQELQPNVIPVNNPQRAFLQLSRMQSSKQILPPQKYFELQESVVLVKYLIEWVITNPENLQDKFTGSVYLYQLKPDPSVNSKNLTVNSVVKENLKSIAATESFSSLSKVDTIKFINDFIKSCNDGNRTIRGTQLFSNNSATEKFPIFYRPSPTMYQKLNLTSIQGASALPSTILNLLQIYKGVKLNAGGKGGYGLIYAKGKVGIPKVPKKRIVPDVKYISGSNTMGALGADKLYLLSHNSQIPGKSKVNMDGTLYGISSEKQAELNEQTASFVRGEQLMELIDLIVRFLVTHTHAYPGLPPVPVTQDGSSVAKMLEELQNATNKILNSNIRLN